MAEETTPVETEPVVPEAPAKKSKLPVVMGALLLLAAAAGGGAWFFLSRGSAAEAEKTEEAPPATKFVLHLDSFTVNLAGAEQSNFLRITIDLGLDHVPDGAEKEKEKNGRGLPIAQIRDSVLSVLTVCDADELLTPEGKTKLKKNLVEVLSRNVPEIGVREVYFTEFLVQR